MKQRTQGHYRFDFEWLFFMGPHCHPHWTVERHGVRRETICGSLHGGFALTIKVAW